MFFCLRQVYIWGQKNIRTNEIIMNIEEVIKTIYYGTRNSTQ